MFDLHTQSISSIVAIGETRTKFISALAEKISNPEHQNTNKFQILIPKQTFCYAKTFTKNNFFGKAFFSKERFVFVIGILILDIV